MIDGAGVADDTNPSARKKRIANAPNSLSNLHVSLINHIFHPIESSDYFYQYVLPATKRFEKFEKEECEEI